MSDREHKARASSLGQRVLALIDEHWPDEAQFEFLELLQLWLGRGGSLVDLQEGVRSLEARGQIVETSLWGTSWRRCAPAAAAPPAPAITQGRDSDSPH